ncbi:hypothetical protein [Yersinia similis]|uniref:hypothetical protein n=1 Tax=Yersinia similis TaxID=367190 RepID=UPI0021BD470E|nr:hypothetical protein [Yersinia similis]
MIKTITAVPVERDANGFWTHPDFFVPANGNEFGVEGEFDAWKALNRVVGKLEWMDCEDNAEELQAAYEAGDCDLSMWQPKPPAGDCWFLASIHDTEDGPGQVGLISCLGNLIQMNHQIRNFVPFLRLGFMLAMAIGRGECRC